MSVSVKFGTGLVIQRQVKNGRVTHRMGYDKLKTATKEAVNNAAAAMTGTTKASDTGFINNYILEPLGLQPISFYSEPKYWPFILVFINIWKSVSYIMYLANLGGIDPGYYETAALDGATRW